LNDGFGGRGGERASEAIDSALILCAEHDLNASALVARTAASAGASLNMCVIAALATLSGERHGGLCDVVERWVGSLATPADAREGVRRRAQLGQSIPGFDHPLYPRGDPRGKALIDLAVSLNRPSLALEVCLSLIDEVNESVGLFPSLDMGLVTLAFALAAPPHAAITLFAVGRTAGWLAHALEQRNAAYLLRPRSRYTGDHERRD
jgi:citrate synthase